MFDWLIPSFFMHNATTKITQKSQVRILTVQQLDDIYSFSHPFISCFDTVQHLRETKVMFLMRGLPGSGKSTLVGILKQLYSNSVTVCSADHYFLDDQGVYNFNRDKLADAHRVCQQKVDEACKNGILAVIVDNTNIRMDECKPYFQKASHYGYVVIIVEPRTAWKRDGDVLAEKNTHSVPRDVIDGRLRQYHPLIPFYFGLFLNHNQSVLVLTRAHDFYLRALQSLPQLKRDLERSSREKNIPVNQLLSRENMNAPGQILHCTVKFFGRVTDQIRKEYDNYAGNRLVSHLLGKLCRGYVVGFVITPRTLAARLLFPDRHTWALWGQDDNEVASKSSPSPSTSSHSKQRSNRRNHNNKQSNPVTTTGFSPSTNDDEDNDAPMVTSLNDEDLLLVDNVPVRSNASEKMSFLHPTSGFLSRAHLTCGVAPGISAAQTGLDMVDMIRKEDEAITNNRTLIETNDEQSVTRYFGDGQCIVYLREPLPINTIFSGFFH